MSDQASAADAQMFDIKNYDLQDLLDIDVNAYLNMAGEEAVICEFGPIPRIGVAWRNPIAASGRRLR